MTAGGIARTTPTSLTLHGPAYRGSRCTPTGETQEPHCRALPGARANRFFTA